MIKQTHRIERLHLLINRKATSSPKKCAQRLSISDRQLYNILNLMKELGAPIYYDMAVESYCYEFEVSFQYGFKRVVKENHIAKNVRL